MHAPQSHVLIDAGESVVADGTVLQGGGAAGFLNWRVKLHTCRGGRSEGVHVVEIDNGAMTIDVLPTRGMGIWRVRRPSLNPSPELGGEMSESPSPSQGGEMSEFPSPSREGVRGGAILGWEAPARQPVHPSFVSLMEPAGLGWLDGFNELLCRCGLESNGPPEFDDAGRLLRPLHGRIANTPADRVELVVDEDAGNITLRGVIDESRFHFQSLRLTTSITTTLGTNEFSWSDEVENIGGREATMQMLYHFNIGQPLLQPGARIHAPIATVAPLTKVASDEGIDTWNIMPPPRPGSAEQVYVAELAADESGDTRVLVTGLTNDEAVSLRFNRRALPCFTLWRNTPAEADGYVVGLEPGTNFPNPRSFEEKNGRAVTLKPGETWRAAVAAVWHSDSQSISNVQEDINKLQRIREPDVLSKPRTGWTANL